MEFNRCERCGSFFISDNNVCCKCGPKDIAEMGILKEYINEGNEIISLDSLAIETGISTKNLNRYLKNEEIINLGIKLD
ncbi:MAG: hypothetical protein IKT41_05860 [Clostridia bacterium]|nr:hypothetical protein [Clostridia bacterium]